MRQTPFTPRGRILVASAAAAALVAAPAVVHGASAAPAAKPAAHAASPAAPAAARTRRKRLRVTLRDFSISVRHRKRVRAGRYTIRVANLGPSSHNLTIRRRGSTVSKGTATIAAGQVTNLRIKLRRGRYTFYCSVPGHAQLGMRVQVRVRRHA
jgi:nitrite reductase (NO-forming)